MGFCSACFQGVYTSWEIMKYAPPDSRKKVGHVDEVMVGKGAILKLSEIRKFLFKKVLAELHFPTHTHKF